MGRIINKKFSGVYGYALVLLAGILWGSIGAFVKELTEYQVSTGMISFLRVGFAFILSLTITLFKEGPSALKISRLEVLRCALLGIVCHGIYNIFYSIAVARAGVTVSAVLLNIAPAITMFTAAFLFQEQLTKGKLIAVCVNILGCVLTVSGGTSGAAQVSVIGIVCGVCAGTCYALTAIFGRLASGSSPWVVSTYSYFFAAVSLVFYARPQEHMQSIPAPALGIAVLYALIPTTIAYGLYYAGVHRISNSSIVPILASAETVVAAVFGIWLYHEALGVINIVGIGLVLTSILISQLRSRDASKQADCVSAAP
ncbi:MAG: DMT family transporter [Lachnospiraceae bacterium]|nr:DMT family transporter [Lachnospiraceae bacterium]